MTDAAKPAPKAAKPAAPVTPAPVTPAPKARPAAAAHQPPAKKPAAPTPAAAVSPAAPATKEPTMDAIKTITDKAQTMFTESNDRAKTTVEKGQKLVGEMTDFNKGNLEALVESSKIAVRGFETLGQDAAAFAKKSFEDGVAAAKTLASVKSPTEFVKLQSDYARTSFDAMVAHNARSTEAMLKLAGEIVQPLSNRFALAAEKVKAAA